MFYFIAASLSIFLLLVVRGPVKLASFKLHGGEITMVDGKDVPEECRSSLISGERFLVKQGFERRCHVARQAVIEGQPWGLYGAVYYSAEDRCWVLCYMEPMPSHFFDYRLLFFTGANGGDLVATINGSEFGAIEPRARKLHLYDALCLSPEQQWQFHQQKCRELLSEADLQQDFDLEQVLVHLEYLYFSGLVDAGVLVPRGDGYRIPLPAAFKVMSRARHIARVLANQQRLNPPTAGREVRSATEDADEGREWNTFETYRNIQASSKMGWLPKLALLVVSVAVFGLAFGVDMSYQSVLVLIGVLFFHELGHLAGMWLFGYKSLSMLFVPFLGALVTGKKQQVSAWQEAIILLLGPLPGYIVGLYMLMSGWSDGSELLFEFAVIAIVLNLFNLLPFMPLDGGKLVELALFSRYPRLHLVFLAISILSLAAMALVLNTYALLIIPILLAVGFPFHYRKSELVKALLRDPAQINDEKSVFAAVRRSPTWQRLGQVERWPLLESLLLDVHYAKTGTAVGLSILALWLGSIVTPPILFLEHQQKQTAWLFLQGLAGFYPEPETLPDLIEQFAREESVRTKANLAVQIISRAQYSEPLSQEDTIDTHSYVLFVENAVEFTTELTVDERGRYAMFLASNCAAEDSACALNYFELATEVYLRDEDNPEKAITPLYQASYQVGTTYAEKLEYLARINRLVEQTQTQAQWNAIAKIRRAELEYEEGNSDEARRWLREAIADTKRHQMELLGYRWKMLVNLSVAEKNWQAARVTAEEWLADAGSTAQGDQSIANNPNYVLAWLWVNEDVETARRYLDKVSVTSAVDQLELKLVRGLWDPVEQQRLSDDTVSAIRARIDRLQDHELYELSYRIFGLDDEYGDDELSPWYLDTASLDRFWYDELRQYLSSPEFTYVRAKLKRLSRNFD